MLAPDILRTAERLHSGPERGYHAWSHPLALLALLPEVATHLHDPRPLSRPHAPAT